MAKLTDKSDNRKITKESIDKSKIINSLHKFSSLIHSDPMVKFTGYLRVAVLIIVAVVLFYSPYPRGLFFQRETLIAVITVFCAFILFWLSKIILKDKSFLKTPLDYAAIALVIIYFIAIFGAVAKREAIMEWVRYCAYFAAFLMVSELATEYKNRIRIMWVLTFSAVGVCILGFDAVSGSVIARVFNNLFEQLGIRVFFTGMTDYGRLASTFQYVNAFAGYLIVAFFVSIGLTMVSDSIKGRLTASVASFIIMLAFVHTLSRGAFLVIPIVAIIYMIALPRGNRIKGFVYMVTPILPAFILTMKLTSYMNEESFSPMVWLLTILGCIATAALTLVLGNFVKYLEKVNWKVYAFGISTLVVLIVVAAIIVLTVSEPLVLSNYDGDKALYSSEVKNVILEPDKEFKLIYDVQAETKEDAPYSYRIEIFTRTESDILFDRPGKRIETYTEKATDGLVTREIVFTVPTESRIVDIRFINYYSGTKAVFSNASVEDSATGKTVKNIVLKYKYMPEILTTRLADLQANKSGLMREIYYRDGFKLFKDFPLIGAGGGAWAYLYQMYQSYYYSTTQAHNFILQLGVETGIIGLIAFAAIVFALIILFVGRFFLMGRFFLKGNSGYEPDSKSGTLAAVLITVILGLLGHSVIDFDLSYTSLGLLLWILMGLFNASVLNVERSGKINKVNTKALSKLHAFMRKLASIRQLRLYPIIGLVLAIAVFVVPVNFVRAMNLGEKSIEANLRQDNQTAMLYMAKAAKTDAFMPEFKIDWANLIKNQETLFAEHLVFADNLMLEAEKLTKYNSQLKAKIGAYYLERGNLEKGLELFDKAAELRPLRPEEWQQRIGAYFNSTIACFAADRADKGLEYIDKTLLLIDEARKVNTKNLNPFIFNFKTSEMLERLRYIKDNLGKQYNFVLDKIVFYNVPSMDINYDEIPDQWNNNVPESVNIKYDKGLMQIENTADSIQYIESRALTLKPGKTYKISIFLNNCDDVESIPYQISGLSDKVENLEKNGTEYSAKIVIPEDFQPSNNCLKLGVVSRYDIITMSIMEE